MPQSLSLVLVHLIFSTKDRQPFLDCDTCSKLHPYLATVARNAGCEAYSVGGVADHVHLAVRWSRTLTIASLIEELKTSSSKWLKTQSPKLAAFSWQRGLQAFLRWAIRFPRRCAPTSLGRKSTIGIPRHSQEEYRAFLTKYGIEFDERYVWDLSGASPRARNIGTLGVALALVRTLSQLQHLSQKERAF